jgi:hypothetical protein
LIGSFLSSSSYSSSLSLSLVRGLLFDGTFLRSFFPTIQIKFVRSIEMCQTSLMRVISHLTALVALPSQDSILINRNPPQHFI